MCPSSARETALFARDASTKRRLIGCRVVFVPPRTAVNFTGRKKKAKKKERTRGFVRRRPTLPFDARAGEATFATRVLLRDVDAENIFVARVACARFLANSGEKKREKQKSRTILGEKEPKRKTKKARRRPQPTPFILETAQQKKREFFESSSSSSSSVSKKIFFFFSKSSRERREDRPTLQKWCVLPLPRFLPL